MNFDETLPYNARSLLKCYYSLADDLKKKRVILASASMGNLVDVAQDVAYIRGQVDLLKVILKGIVPDELLEV